MKRVTTVLLLIAGTLPAVTAQEKGHFNRQGEYFTGTIITVTGEELRRVDPDNLARALEVFVPSLRVQHDASTLASPHAIPSATLRAGQDGEKALALFIDGHEASRERLHDMNLNEVASVTLLTDAAATAVHGARGGNGVILVTTNTPREGGVKVDYRYALQALFPSRVQQARDVVGHRHALRVDGGTSRFRFGIDGTYRGEPGIMPRARRDRAGGSLSLAFDAGPVTLDNRFTLYRADGTSTRYNTNGTIADDPGKQDDRGLADEFTARWQIARDWQLAGSLGFRREELEGTARVKVPASLPGTVDTVIVTRGYLERKHAGGYLVLSHGRVTGDHAYDLALGVDLARGESTVDERSVTGKTELRWKSRSRGALASLNYVYRDRYLLDLSARVDKLSAFVGEDDSPRAWSAGVAWNVHREAFARGWGFSCLRLKANAGNTAWAPYPGTTALPNEALQEWSRTRASDAGLDVGLAGNRLLLSGVYYRRATREEVTVVTPISPVPQLFDMVNKGYEVDVKWQAIARPGMSLALTGSLVHGKRAAKSLSGTGSTGGSSTNIPAGPNPPKVEASFGGEFCRGGFLARVVFFTRLGGHAFESLISSVGSGSSPVRVLQRTNVFECRSLHLAYEISALAERVGLSSLRAALTANDPWRVTSMKQPGLARLTCSLHAAF
jgi:TonB-dependent SusC/RagA subfamily outer membrane receptor